MISVRINYMDLTKEDNMKKKSAKRLCTIFLAMSMLLASVLATGCSSKDPVEAYPDQDIRIIVAFNPGGQTDLISRKLAEIIEKEDILPVSIVTVNMAGGNTADAINATLQADPDDYTFFMHHSNLVTNYIMGNLETKYDEMDMLGGIMDQPFGIVKRSDDDRFADVFELVEYIKAHPGELTCGFPGYASPGHFALLQFLAANGISGMVQEVPYAGGAEAIEAHLGGHTDLRATNMGDSARYVASGDIEFLCMISQDVNPDYPDVPTLKDLGSDMEGLVLHTGLFAPKGIPEEIKTKFMDAIHKAMETEEFAQFTAEMCNTMAPTDAETFKALYDNDLATLEELAKTLTQQ